PIGVASRLLVDTTAITYPACDRRSALCSPNCCTAKQTPVSATIRSPGSASRGTPTPPCLGAMTGRATESAIAEPSVSAVAQGIAPTSAIPILCVNDVTVQKSVASSAIQLAREVANARIGSSDEPP